MVEPSINQTGTAPIVPKGIRDREAKFEAILRYARYKNSDRTWNLARLPEAFGRSVNSFDNRAKNWNLGGSNPTGESRDVFERMLIECHSQFDFDEFRVSSYAEFLRSIPSNIRRRFDPHVRAESRLLFTIDPRHISHNPEDEWRTSRVVNQKYMYVTPFSASKWKDLSESSDYHNSDLCCDTLSSTVKLSELDDIETVIILGCGSPSKEKMILEAVCAKSPDRSIRAVFIDASVFMLAYSANELIESGIQDHISVFSEMYCIDFTQENQWEDNIEFSDREKKAFFIIGETIGNIDEYGFRSVINRFAADGDLIVVGAEFFSSEQELIDSEDELVSTYSKNTAKDLVLSSLDHLIARAGKAASEQDRYKLIDVTWVSDARSLPTIAKSEIPFTKGICFKTIGAITSASGSVRLPQLTLSVSRRYVESAFVSKMNEACSLAHLHSVTHPKGKRYSHIIFRKAQRPGQVGGL